MNISKIATEAHAEALRIDSAVRVMQHVEYDCVSPEHVFDLLGMIQERSNKLANDLDELQGFLSRNCE